MNSSEELFRIDVRSEETGVAFNREYRQRAAAESCVQWLKGTDDYRIEGMNFTPCLTREELDSWQRSRTRENREADRKQQECWDRTMNNLKDPQNFPCEVCGGKHHNYVCCHQCNYVQHRCHFCGDELGHREVSACYLLDDD